MSLEELILRIDENQAKINAHGKFDDAILKKINYKFRLDWNYYSNRMEGGTLTREETRSVMVGNISVDGKPIKDVMEMNGHDKVVIDILKIGKGELRLSEKRIKEIHKAIMHEEDAVKAKEIGEWKSKPNEIINYKNEKISFASPTEVPQKIHSIIDAANAQLDAFFNNKKDKRHPLLIASDFHLDYVHVHPFYDGNGRTARIFTNLILIACGLPVIIIKDEHKEQYYRYLADIQVYGGSAELFYSFIGERILDSQNLILDALAGKEIEESSDLDKRISMLLKTAALQDEVKEKKSIKSVYRVLNDIILPLFKETEINCMKLNDLFIDYLRSIHFSIANGQRFTILNTGQSIESFKENWLNVDYLNEKPNLSNFVFEYNWKGYKKSVNAYSESVAITVCLDEYNYEILTAFQNRGQGLKKTYNAELSPKEKDDIIKKTIEPVLNQIENFIERG